VAKILSAERHPNADRLQVCQVETVDGVKEIVCGAPNARAGLTTIYAPIGAYVPGLGVTLVEKPVRGVVSNGMLCSASELELADESDGIQELPPEIPVGTPVAGLFGAEPVIDFEVTPNRPDWLGVAGIARDLAAASVGKLKHFDIAVVRGAFPSPITVRLDAPEMCPVFAGRVIRGVKNGPSPAWLQKRLTAIGLRSINRLVDVTNLIAYDRARPLHVYDVAKLVGTEIVVRGGQVSAETAHIEGGEPEHLIALDGKTYTVAPRPTASSPTPGASAPSAWAASWAARAPAATRPPPTSSLKAPGSTRWSSPRPAVRWASIPTPSTGSRAASIRSRSRRAWSWPPA
jgi:phenylalanyl-tRNA synthetase beta chain